MDIESVMKTLNSDERGLSNREAAERIQKYGTNTLPQKPPPPFWKTFIYQFRSPLMYILAFAALIAILIREPTDAGFIIIALLLNAIIGGYQEWRAEESAKALQRLLQIKATVQREGEVADINADSVVPGDIVWLE